MEENPGAVPLFDPMPMLMNTARGTIRGMGKMAIFIDVEHKATKNI